ncbi:MAG: polysaccharide biosynthesis protein PslG [Thermoleophilaceae bacterium]|jgi:hypothetical protein|nr:polysaccharide biosynthesis protein PslG [Thermoleophilaceae bacterium]
MTALRRLTLLFALSALTAATIAATPAEAAKRKVPFGFFGAVIPPELSYPGRVPDAVLDRQLALMARSGVESVRLTFAWETLEPGKGQFTLGNLDRLIRASANHHLAVVLNVTQSPHWASARPNNAEWQRYGPAPSNSMAPLWGVLAARYGRNGTFWAQNPTVPRNPVTQWQIWNEQSAPWMWAQRPWAPSYVQVLKWSAQAIKAADKKAIIVAGSVVASPNYSQWGAIRDLYKAGGKGLFDQIAVHPFTNNSLSVDGTVDQTLEIITRVRKETRKARDGRVPIILTELTWPASVGKIPKKALLGVETTPRGQLQRLKAGYQRLVKLRKRIGVTQAYWYTWSSEYNAEGSPSVMSFRYAGLTRQRGSVFKPMPILKIYTSLARKYEGCRKGNDARRCR